MAPSAPVYERIPVAPREEDEDPAEYLFRAVATVGYFTGGKGG